MFGERFRLTDGDQTLLHIEREIREARKRMRSAMIGRDSVIAGAVFAARTSPHRP